MSLGWAAVPAGNRAAPRTAARNMARTLTVPPLRYAFLGFPGPRLAVAGGRLGLGCDMVGEGVLVGKGDGTWSVRTRPARRDARRPVRVPSGRFGWPRIASASPTSVAPVALKRRSEST
jgi:hypothetical protein